MRRGGARLLHGNFPATSSTVGKIKFALQRTSLEKWPFAFREGVTFVSVKILAISSIHDLFSLSNNLISPL